MQTTKEKKSDEIRACVVYSLLHLIVSIASSKLFMPPKELWEAYSNRAVRPSVRPCVRPAFVSGPYLLYSLR